MAARPNWKGYLKLSLVACPVALYPATTTAQKISFHLLNRATGHRLRRQMVDEDTKEAVGGEDQVHGYAVAKDDYLIVEDDEIDALAIESTHTIDVDQFVPRDDISPIYLDTPYYLVPDGKMGEEAFAVIREAMRRRKMVGVARIVLARREHPVLLEPHGRGIVATTLRYPYEVKPDKEVFGDIPAVTIGDDMLDLAGHIIDTKTRKFDPSAFEDRYEAALAALLKAKKTGKPAKGLKAPATPSNVVDLMEALRRSVGGAPKPAARAGAAAAEKKAPAGKRAKARATRPSAGRKKAG